MMNLRHSTALTLILILAFSTVDSAVGDDATTSIKSPGERYFARLESLLKSLKHTQYQHTTDIDEAGGSVECDCSGLVGFVLRQTCPEAYVALRGDEAQWRKRPLSVTYYESFVAAEQNPNGWWKRVTKLQDAVPGDVLSWRKKDLKAGSTTGHTCTIASTPKMVGEGMVRVRLIDSTRSPHENDTRAKGENGMGAGDKTFLVDSEGQCVGYLRGERRVTSIIAIGRIVQPTATASHEEDKVFVGLTADAATKLAKQRKRSWRIIREDGNPKRIRMAIQNERLNFVIENKQMVRVLRG